MLVEPEPEIEQDDLLLFSIAEFMTKKRLLYTVSSKLSLFIQQLVETIPLNILKMTSISRNTLSHLVQNCIGQSIKEELYKEMRRSPFSLSLDQSSDSYGKNYLAVCVKYLPENNLPEPKTKLLGIIQMGDSYTGEVIFTLNSFQIRPLKY